MTHPLHPDGLTCRTCGRPVELVELTVLRRTIPVHRPWLPDGTPWHPATLTGARP